MLRETLSNEWFTVLLIISIVLIAGVKLMFTNRFNNFVILVGNSKYLKIYSREQKNFELFNGFLFLNLIISLSLFIILIKRNQSNTNDINFDLFFKLSVGIGAILLIKVLIERLLGNLFEIGELTDSYLFQKISYRNYLGLILIPINILFVFTIYPSKAMIYTIIALLLTINFIGIITTIRYHQKSLINNLFYFILYLCALEISPYIILYKLIIK